MAVDTEKVEFCRKLDCDELGGNRVCGLRPEGAGFRIRLFENQCVLMKYGCRVKDEDAYGIINLKYCVQTFTNSRRHYDATDKANYTKATNDISENPCNKLNCVHTGVNYLCGLRQEGDGFKIKLFFNECHLLKYNCEKKLDFYTTDIRTCKGLYRPKEPTYKISKNNEEIEDASSYTTLKENELNNEDSPVLNEVDEANDEVNDISSSDRDSTTPIETTTIPYETDLPIDYGDLATDATSTSTDGVKYISGVPVPKNLIVLDGGMLNYNGNINETMENFLAATHLLDLPVKEVTKEVCPDTYAPVCGIPGTVAREPSLMFQNHCFMDATQCKMRWDDKSETAESSAYVETTFMMCLGDQMNGLYRFMPLIRTLQHMGRLKDRAQVHYKVRNMRFRSEFNIRESKVMG